MWGFQSHFARGVERATEAVFNSIGTSTAVEVHLVGIRIGDGENPICVEPEDGYFNPDQLRDVVARGAQLYDEHPRSKMAYGAQHLHVRIHAELRDTCRATAIREVLEAQHPGHLAFFVANSEIIGDYAVHTAIGVPHGFLEQTPSLATETHPDKPIYPSLVVNAVDEVLQDARTALLGRDPGSNLRLGRPAAEMARSAARQLVHSMGVLAGYPFGTPLFEVLNEVATMKYEQRVGLGRMLLVQPDSAGVDVQLRLSRKVRLDQHRTIRKLLELSGSRGMALLTDGQDVYGLGGARDDYDARGESMFSITIAEQGTWEIGHAGERMMQVRYGRPLLPAPKITRERFEEIALRVFGEDEEFDAETLWEVIQAATEAEHGTMIVVSAGAEAEAQRLNAQALEIAATRVTSEQVRSLTTIDGALLFGPNALLQAIGVILDGTASTKGDPSRGARFNSAVRYLESSPIPTMIVLVSEDGMINLLPDLRDRVSRKRIDTLIDTIAVEADRVLSGESDIVRFNEPYRQLEQLRFYLSGEQCEQINGIRKRVEGRKLDGYEIGITRGDVAPNPDMNDSYFLD